MRLYWMILGHSIVVLIGVALYTHQLHADMLMNAPLGAAMFACIIARLIDIKWYNGTTGDGQPATMKHFTHYTMFILGYSVPIWAGIQLYLRSAA